MCGLVAALDPGGADRARIARGVAALEHRGPDGRGVFCDGPVGIGHTRLAMVAPTSGAQPIESADGDLVLAVNGELYGYEAQRRELRARGSAFTTDSDAEVLLHLYRERGLDALHMLEGEFAFVLWDRRRRALVAGRDRFGIKPLVYHRGGALLIASEAKALFAMGVPAAWDRQSLRQAFAHQYLHPDRTLFDGVAQIPPGCALIADSSGVSIRRWWTLPLLRSQPIDDAHADIDDAADAVRAVLGAAVRDRLRGDAIVGCQLSGGLDSSAVAALAAVYATPMCFTVQFTDDAAWDEAQAARSVAEHLGLPLDIVEVNQRALLDELPDAVARGEGLVINTHAAAKRMLIRRVRARGVKALLSGEGADELFWGYAHLVRDAGYEPAPDVAISGVHLPAGDALDVGGFERALGLAPSFLRAKATLGRRIHAVIDPGFVAGPDPFAALAEALGPSLAAARGDAEAELGDGAGEPSPAALSAWVWIQLCLSGYILKTLCDPLELADGVEGRLPFLDTRVVGVAMRLPAAHKVGPDGDKLALRRAARSLLPAAIASKPKHPFMGPPLVVDAALRERLLAGLPDFVSREALERLLAEIPSMSRAQRVAFDPVLLTVLSLQALGERYRL